MTSLPIIALDLPTQADVEIFLEKFPRDEKLFVKVGMELFYQAGPDVVRCLKDRGYDIFLDLKLHDIPNTVYRAMKNLGGLGVDLTNVHAAGGAEMMKAGLQGLQEGAPAGKVPQLFAVTQLTSTTQENMHIEQKIMSTLEESVISYAKLTESAGLAGVVCSALEAKKIHEATSDNFLCLTPGIRPAGSAVGDQKCVMTPSQARANGSNFIVVGRPITQAKEPYQRYLTIKNEWSAVL